MRLYPSKNTSVFLKHYDKSNWKKVRLGDVVDIFSGGTPKTSTPEYWNGDILWCTPTDITANEDKYISDTEQKISALGLQNSAARLLPENTLLLCSRATIGAVKIATKPICTNQGFKNLVCRDVMDTDFLYYYIPKLKPQMIFLASGSTFLEISKKQLAGIEFAIPTAKSEQVYIANVLSKIDSAIINLQKLISKQESIKKTTVKLLLQPKEDWITKTIGEICDFYAAGSKSSYITENGQYYIVDMGAISSDGLLIATKQTNYACDFLKKNDLVMPKDDIGGGQIIGKTIVIEEDDKYILGDHVYKLTTTINAKFLSYLINSPDINKYMRKMATGSAQLGLSKHSIAKCKVCFPAQETEQQRIAAQLNEIDAHIDNLKQQLAKQRAIKQGLMDYFFGN